MTVRCQYSSRYLAKDVEFLMARNRNFSAAFYETMKQYGIHGRDLPRLRKEIKQILWPEGAEGETKSQPKPRSTYCSGSPRNEPDITGRSSEEIEKMLADGDF